MSMKDISTTDKGGWKPQAGETIAGLIADIDVGEGGHGPYPIIEIDVGDGVVPVHAFHDGLRKALKMRGAQVGEKVSITFRGRAGDGNGTDAYLYTVQVGDTPQQFDYDRLTYTAKAKLPGTPVVDDVPPDAQHRVAVRDVDDDSIPF
jgi:hypothetical protein